MPLTPTLEIRWFEYGTIPIAVKRWFDEFCPGESLEWKSQREDLYLYLPKYEALNFKLRQGNLELKWRRAELGTQQFKAVESAISWDGKIEQWLKLSLKNLFPSRLINVKSWVAVNKVRSQRSYLGANCELTQLNVNNEFWWTIALEMPKRTADDINQFHRLIERVNQTYQGPELSLLKSYAYPQWLAIIVQKCGNQYL
jgi:hypothetical protein